MKTYITETQKRELEELANNGHAEAIMAAMTDMYHEGWADAGKFAEAICYRTFEVVGVGCAMVLVYRIGKRIVKTKNNKVKQKNES